MLAAYLELQGHRVFAAVDGADALAAAIGGLLADPGERLRLEERASAAASGPYSWDRIAEQTAREEGKPEAALSKIIEGRVNSFFKDFVLVEQASVTDPKKTVAQVLTYIFQLRAAQREHKSLPALPKIDMPDA